MKKILSLFLVLTMVLSMLTLPTLAAGDETATPTATPTTVVSPAEIGENATVSYNSKTYSVIRTPAEFLAITNNTNYILANDITLTGTLNGNTIKATTNYTINGNGYSVTFDMNNTAAGYGLFAQVAANSNVTFANITFNVSGKLAANSTGVIIGTAQGSYNTSRVTFDTVIMNCNNLQYTHTTTSQGAGIFYAKVRTHATFKNCLLTGTFTSTQPGQGGVGGYIGLADCSAANTEVIFENCKATGTYNVNSTSTQKFGVFVGYTCKSNISMSFDNCEFDGTLNGKGARVAAFVADSSNTSLEFNNCSLKGVINMNAASQSGGFVGLFEGSTATVFNNCTADAKLFGNGNRVAPFVGQAFCNGSVEFNNCLASGTCVFTGKWCAGFVGVAAGTYASKNQETNEWPTSEAAAKKVTITFNDCDIDAFIVSTSQVAGYVGSNAGGNPTLIYDDCKNNATIYSCGSAGAWYGVHDVWSTSGSPIYATTATSFDVKNNCVNNATIYALSLSTADDGNPETTDYNDTTVNFTQISAEALADGSYAYAIAQAQAAKGMTTNIVGQTIGTNAAPVVGGAAVYEYETLKVGKVYSNLAENYVDTVDCAEAPKAYVQYTTPDGEGKFNARVIIAVSEAKLAEIDNVTITLTFKTGEEVVKTKTVGQGGIDSYYAVYAGDQLAQAAEGYVLVAVTVTGIPTAEWSNETGTVSVSMAAFDANGDAMPEYTLA